MSRSRIVQLGIAGAGPDWDAAYRPALERLQGRVRVSAVHSVPGEVANRLAGESEAAECRGLRSLLRRDDVQGALLLHPDWHGLFPLEVAIEAGRPACFALPSALELSRLQRLAAGAAAGGTLAMPELRLRYTPATLRLRELLATELGPVQRIDICSRSRGLASSSLVQMQLFDWCHVVLGGRPRSIESRMLPETKGGHVLSAKLHYLRNGHDVAADIRLQHEPGTTSPPHAPTHPADEWPIECTLRCRYGEARLEDAVHLRWRGSGRERVESLATDRTAVAVAIDHFARRLAGGLLPVPGLEDVVASLKLVEEGRRSLSERRSIACESTGA